MNTIEKNSKSKNKNEKEKIFEDSIKSVHKKERKFTRKGGDILQKKKGHSNTKRKT